MFKELSAKLMDVVVVNSGSISHDGLALPAEGDWIDDLICWCCCCCCCGSTDDE